MMEMTMKVKLINLLLILQNVSNTTNNKIEHEFGVEIAFSLAQTLGLYLNTWIFQAWLQLTENLFR